MDRQFNKISVISIQHIDPNVDYEALQIPSEFNISNRFKQKIQKNLSLFLTYQASDLFHI